MTTTKTTTTTNSTDLLLWSALTPVHSGTGQGGSGVIDLAIAREVATQFPILPASSIKGVLRDGQNDDESNKRFGHKDAAGKLTFTDARLLCLPVRSYKGTFAYVTCPLIIRRLKRELSALALTEHAERLPELPADLPAVSSPEGHPDGGLAVHVSDSSALVHKDKVLFEDIDLVAKICPAATKLAKVLAEWTGLEDGLKQRLAVVSNDVFSYFSETATEVTAHTSLDPDTKTVKSGALWYEECLPVESILSSLLIRDGIEYVPSELLQVGGKGSVGRGLLSLRVVPATKEEV